MTPEQTILIDRTLGIVGNLSVIGAAVFVMLAIHFNASDGAAFASHKGYEIQDAFVTILHE
jgi:hypothetical protein